MFVDMSLPQPSGGFEWVQESWGAALHCRPLTTVASHCFSTRQLSLDGARSDEPATWNDLAHALGIELGSLVRLRQVHCVDVYVANAGQLHPFACADWPEADIAISDDPSTALSVRSADCVPILLADRRGGAVAAIHAGWKGTAAGAAMVAVDALRSRYGSRPDDVIAAVGPSIGPCCYEVGPDLLGHFASHPEADTWFSKDPKPHLDLWRATRDQIARAGVPSTQIHVSALCTFDHPELFHSYRRDGRNAGRLVAAIRSAPGKTP
jgi:YfiH family protein